MAAAFGAAILLAQTGGFLAGILRITHQSPGETFFVVYPRWFLPVSITGSLGIVLVALFVWRGTRITKAPIARALALFAVASIMVSWACFGYGQWALAQTVGPP